MENHTSFQRVVRKYGPQDGVIWLPGFAPNWWKDSVARLLLLKPALTLIACDPDPAGIEIALQAGAVWEAAGLPWQPWQMGAAQLANLAFASHLLSGTLHVFSSCFSAPFLTGGCFGSLDVRVRGKGEQEVFL